ncbi:MAG: peptide deformylase [Bacteroidales bacterium]|jgi:peptide deformylase|nr:peptide deformylase [Synergistaceae bacterium]MDD2330848.1 peptide deformylase [Bacteroidales bacterium]
MIVPIVIYGAPVLRQSTFDIHQEDLPDEITGNLFDTLKSAEGIGLAAPQIGLAKRIFVIDTTPMADEYADFKSLEKVYLNPRILHADDTLSSFNEGCLSIPGIFRELDRPERIHVIYQNLAFETVEEELSGLEARIFQHEYDHLDGILFIDRLSGLQKRLIQGKLNKIKKRRR